MGGMAVVKMLKVVDNIEIILGIELMCACQVCACIAAVAVAVAVASAAIVVVVLVFECLWTAGCRIFA